MSTAELTYPEAQRIVRAELEVKDKRYRRFPVGQEVGAFMRALRVERKALNTRESYESVLRLLALDHPELELQAFGERGGGELLTAFLDRHWGDASDATMIQRIGVLRSFFAWAERTERLDRDPMRRLRTPRQRRQATRRAHELAKIRRIVGAQEKVRDEVGLLLMGRLAFRKMDVGSLRVRDVDLEHDVVHIRKGKGGKPATVPIVFREVRDALSLWLSEGHHPDEYLLGPRGDLRRRPNPATVHRWFKRCLERAGAEDFPMHELRHSAGDSLWRGTGNIVLAQELMRHVSESTTRGYLHPTEEDLRAGMRALEAYEDGEIK